MTYGRFRVNLGDLVERQARPDVPDNRIGTVDVI
jgi:hypothetical protein